MCLPQQLRNLEDPAFSEPYTVLLDSHIEKISDVKTAFHESNSAKGILENRFTDCWWKILSDCLMMSSL